MKIETYIQISRALIKLLHPFVEVVIHNLSTNTIVFIEGGLSERKIGDPSLLDKAEIDGSISKDIYPKINFDGRLIKSISILLPEIHSLMCINCDVTVFQEMHRLSEYFLADTLNTQPQVLFAKDWQERIHKELHRSLSGLSIQNLSSQQKKDLVFHLYQNGAFEEKKAADYIAKILLMGRATVFKYLREWKKDKENK